MTPGPQRRDARWVLVGAPSNLGLRPTGPGPEPGTRNAPEVLRTLGLVDRCGLEDLGDVVAPAYVGVQERGRRLNESALVNYSLALADRLAPLIGDRRILLLGGDCSILLGALSAARRAGPVSLVHVDGHTDFRHDGNHRSPGAVAGEDLAMAVGLGPVALTSPGGMGPLVAPAAAAHVGCRADDEHLEEVREALGLVVTAHEVAASPVLAARRLQEHVVGCVPGTWVHLDVDVLDPSVMPAVDAPSPDGVTLSQLVALLTPVVSMAEVIGMSVSVYDPARDADRKAGRRLVELLAQVLVGGADAEGEGAWT